MLYFYVLFALYIIRGLNTVSRKCICYAINLILLYILVLSHRSYCRFTDSGKQIDINQSIIKTVLEIPHSWAMVCKILNRILPLTDTSVIVVHPQITGTPLHADKHEEISLQNRLEIPH